MESEVNILRPNHFHDFTVRKRATDNGVLVDINASDRRRMSAAGQFLYLSYFKCAFRSVSWSITSATSHLQPLRERLRLAWLQKKIGLVS
uniref:Uncharacterized protein n=1 Tax=Ixodes ricinus TaxID=34613 RepID=A0A6B0U376_IXORI